MSRLDGIVLFGFCAILLAGIWYSSVRNVPRVTRPFFEAVNILVPLAVVLLMMAVMVYVFSYFPDTEASRVVESWNQAASAEKNYSLYFGIPLLLFFGLIPILAFVLYVGNK